MSTRGFGGGCTLHWLFDRSARLLNAPQPLQYSGEVLRPAVDLLRRASAQEVLPRLLQSLEVLLVGIRVKEQGVITRPPEAEDVRVRADLPRPIRVQLLGGGVVQRARDSAADHRSAQGGRPCLRSLDQAAPQRQAKVDDLDPPAACRL